MTRRSRTVWLFASSETEMLDLAGPWEVLAHANDALGREAYRCQLVSANGGEIPTRHGLFVARSTRLPRAPARLPDIAIVAGGSPSAAAPLDQRMISRWLERHRAGIGTFAGVCTGAFVLGAAGLLDGRRATTHWRYTEELRRRFPKAKVGDEGIFVRDRETWTSAGITAGIDLTLALVEDHHGHEIAMAVAKHLVLFLRRSGQQAQFSSVLRRQARSPERLQSLSAFILENLDASLTVARLGKALGMSARSLTRWCKEHLAESPAELVRRHRTEEAQRLLESTQLPLKAVAARAGFGDAASLWRAFTRYVGTTPSAYRSRFAAASVGEGQPRSRDRGPVEAPRATLRAASRRGSRSRP